VPVGGSAPVVQEAACGISEGRTADTGGGQQVAAFAMGQEPGRQAQRVDGGGHTRFGAVVGDQSADTAHADTVLDAQGQAVPTDQVGRGGVDRGGPAGIGNGGTDPVSLQDAGCVQAGGRGGSDRNEKDVQGKDVQGKDVQGGCGYPGAGCPDRPW